MCLKVRLHRRLFPSQPHGWGWPRLLSSPLLSSQRISSHLISAHLSASHLISSRPSIRPLTSPACQGNIATVGQTTGDQQHLFSFFLLLVLPLFSLSLPASRDITTSWPRATPARGVVLANFHYLGKSSECCSCFPEQNSTCDNSPPPSQKKKVKELLLLPSKS